MNTKKKKTTILQQKQRFSSPQALLRPTLVCMLALTGTFVAEAQMPGSALDYMLQRPRVTKQYEQKKFGDHLFLDGGLGVNMMGSSDLKPGVTGEVNIGDWITPEHGMRLQVNGGLFRTHSIKAKYAGLSLDYLLNITALSRPGTTYSPSRFEVYGIAGADVAFSHNEQNTEHGVGAHIGLRGQVAVSPYTYFYVEPRAGIMQDDVSQVETWHNFRPEASLSLGFGYRLPEHSWRATHTADSLHRQGRGLDGVFVSVMGGPLGFANARPSSWRHNAGGRTAVSIGKWFSPYSALRLTANATTFKQSGAHRVKAGGFQFDYLLNLHNAFGGVDASRRFWVNGVAGISANLSSAGEGHNRVFGLGGGLQANVRLSRDVDFFLEPRVDAYREEYAPQLSTAGNWDVTAALMAGLTYTYHDRRDTALPNDPFEQLTWHDHTFVEMGIGGNIPITRDAMGNAFEYVRPQAYAAIGKWFSPLHGARLWGQLAQTEYDNGRAKRYKHMSAGADYLFNFTNAFYGYRDYRAFDLIGALGGGVAYRQKHSGLFGQADASLRGTWHVNPFIGLFIEPRLQMFGHRFLPTSLGSSKVDIVASATAGVQFNMHGFNRASAYATMQEDGEELRSSFSVAGGFAAQANHLRAGEYYGPVGRISYTQWYTPLSAWRINVQGYLRGNVGGHKYAQMSAGADYMTDLTAQTYGYDAQRALSVNAFVGANLGVDYSNKKTTFAPDLHVGGQLSVRLSNAVHLFAEPQMSLRLSSRFKDQKLARFLPQMLFGLDYSLNRSSVSERSIAASAYKRFVSASLGTGVFSANFNQMHPARRKLTFVADASYGQWLNGISGFHAGISTTVAQRQGRGNENITSLHADYMMNLRAAVSGESTDDKLFQVTGLVGATLNFGSRKSRDLQIVPGLQGAVQAGFRLSPNFELYLEPAAAIYSNRIEPGGTAHPLEGELKLTLGTKFYF